MRHRFIWLTLLLLFSQPASADNHYFDIQNTRVLQSSDLSVTDAAGHTQDRTIRSLGYDALGRVTSNDRGHNAVSMAYQYNPLRGWITQISTADDGFQQKLYREDNPGNPLYNGSISAMEWKVPSQNPERRYDYTYDGLNRLTEGAYSQQLVHSPPILPLSGDEPLARGGTDGEAMPLELIPVTGEGPAGLININAAGRYSERIRYDKNSNVSDVARYGMNNLRGYGVIDSLEITRSGNQLVAIEDHAEKNLTYTGASDFVDGTNIPQEYTYDGNGRLTMDTNRGIGSITYDQCNNPQAIAFSGTNGIDYVYAPDGTRLRTVHVLSGIGGSVTRDTTDYLGNLVMRDSHLGMYRFDGGYVSFSNDTIDGWHLYISDYMGNNRLVVRDSIIEQITHYYPYGGVIGDISTNENVQKYKFEGKELDRTFGLDNYDIHARQYFAMAPTWDRIDPMTEDNPQFSPYSYCMGDPVNLGDYNGLDTLYFKMNKDGKTANYDNKIISDGKHIGIIKTDSGQIIQFSFVYQKDADRFKKKDNLTDEDILDKSLLTGVSLIDKETLKSQIECVPGWLGSLPFGYRYLSLAYAFMQSRGTNGTLDFVNYPLIQDRPRHLFIPNDNTNIAHDSFNFGNYLWGAGMRRLGIPLSVSLIGGNIDSLKHNNLQFDSIDDMKSISLGYLFCPQPSLFKNYFGF